MSEQMDSLLSTSAQQDTIPCPYCGEQIKVGAKKCRYCGEWLDREPSTSERPDEVIGMVPVTVHPVEIKPKRQRKIGAGLIGGLLAGFLGYFLISIMASEPQIWAFWLGWIVFGLIFIRRGWPAVWSNLSIMSFLLPVSVFIFGAATTTNYTDDAEQAGAALGTFFATGVAGFAGFFFGIMFALLAFFVRSSKHK